MDDQWNTEHFRQLLNRSLDQLDQSTLASLRAARIRAISRHKTRSVPLSLFAWAGGHITLDTAAHRHVINYWLGAFVLVACIFSSIVYWQQAMDNDTSDVDVEILTDDLPINYYAD